MTTPHPHLGSEVTITLSVAELKQMISDGVEHGIETALTNMGIDAKKPLEAQKDFAFLREMRTGTKALTGKVLLGLIMAAAIALAGWTWYGYVNAIHTAGVSGTR